jgi:putative transposase
MPSDLIKYPGYRFPVEVIQHAVWLYHLFSLSLRDIELILAERGIVVSHESVRRWCLCFGADFAAKLRKRRPRPGDGFRCELAEPPRAGTNVAWRDGGEWPR